MKFLEGGGESFGFPNQNNQHTRMKKNITELLAAAELASPVEFDGVRGTQRSKYQEPRALWRKLKLRGFSVRSAVRWMMEQGAVETEPGESEADTLRRVANALYQMEYLANGQRRETMRKARARKRAGAISVRGGES